jgi:hypothetical protein
MAGKNKPLASDINRTNDVHSISPIHRRSSTP